MFGFVKNPLIDSPTFVGGLIPPVIWFIDLLKSAAWLNISVFTTPITSLNKSLPILSNGEPPYCCCGDKEDSSLKISICVVNEFEVNLSKEVFPLFDPNWYTICAELSDPVNWPPLTSYCGWPDPLVVKPFISLLLFIPAFALSAVLNDSILESVKSVWIPA